MRSSLLRILLAMVVGLWSPLCCCQAAMIAGALSGLPGQCLPDNEQPTTSIVQPRCCDHCREEPASADDSDSPDQHPAPGDRTPCGDCPACQGMLGLARLDDGGAALNALNSAIAVLFIALPVESAPLFCLQVNEHLPRPPDFMWRHAGGRVLLRWHCALVV